MTITSVIPNVAIPSATKAILSVIKMATKQPQWQKTSAIKTFKWLQSSGNNISHN